jgi:hypothetical protein
MANESANTKESGRKRHNITMNEDVRERAETLATFEKRSVSNLLEVLVDREFERLEKEGKLQTKVAA